MFPPLTTTKMLHSAAFQPNDSIGAPSFSAGLVHATNSVKAGSSSLISATEQPRPIVRSSSQKTACDANLDESCPGDVVFPNRSEQSDDDCDHAHHAYPVVSK